MLVTMANSCVVPFFGGGGGDGDGDGGGGGGVLCFLSSFTSILPKRARLWSSFEVVSTIATK